MTSDQPSAIDTERLSTAGMLANEIASIEYLAATVQTEDDKTLQENINFMNHYFDSSYVLPRDCYGIQFDPRGTRAWHAAATKLYNDEQHRRESLNHSAKSAHTKK